MNQAINFAKRNQKNQELKFRETKREKRESKKIKREVQGNTTLSMMIRTKEKIKTKMINIKRDQEDMKKREISQQKICQEASS
jgi:hypothetical protein